MTRASLCLAAYMTMILALAHGMATGNGWPMIAASVLCLLLPTALRRS